MITPPPHPFVPLPKTDSPLPPTWLIASIALFLLALIAWVNRASRDLRDFARAYPVPQGLPLASPIQVTAVHRGNSIEFLVASTGRGLKFAMTSRSPYAVQFFVPWPDIRAVKTTGSVSLAFFRKSDFLLSIPDSAWAKLTSHLSDNQIAELALKSASFQ